MRILLVEDDPVDAKLINRYLNGPAGRDYDIVHVTGLQAALEQLRSGHFYVVLVDLNLPDSAGVGTISEVMKSAGRTPIIAVTGLDDERLALEALRVGAKDYLPKHEISAGTLKRAIKYAQERQATENRLRYLASYDQVTKLPNRNYFHQELTRALQQAQRAGTMVAVLLLDLDNLKKINDSFGHHVGDDLLCQSAARMQECIRETDTLARLGGDEFAFTLTNITWPAQVMPFLKRLRESHSKHFIVAGKSLHSSASVGIAFYPADDDRPEGLLQKADVAMYEAKSQGRNGFRFFEAEMQANMEFRTLLASDLNDTLESGGLHLFYQPILDAASLATQSVEALVRWPHPQHGSIPPNTLISVAEEAGLIDDFGRWSIGQACRQQLEWQQAGVDLPIAVNVSPQQFHRYDIAAAIDAALRTSGLDGSALVVEVTENMLMQDSDVCVARLKKLRDRGVRVHIDDFGTGFSSLSYLKKFPADSLKIDRSFVQGLVDNAEDLTIVRSIISLAHNLGLKVVAEGVETAAQRDMLCTEGCDMLQGFLFSPAVPADDLADWLSASPDRPVHPPVNGALEQNAVANPA